jgi:hypothetical protein
MKKMSATETEAFAAAASVNTSLHGDSQDYELRLPLTFDAAGPIDPNKAVELTNRLLKSSGDPRSGPALLVKRPSRFPM